MNKKLFFFLHVQISQNIDGFRQNKNPKLSELVKLYKQNTLDNFFFFIIYRNYRPILALTSIKFQRRVLILTRS